MTFWQFLDKHWPSERGWVIILLTILIGSLLKMADHDPRLWDVKLFEILIQGCILTGALNMVLAFYFAANRSDEVKAENTKAAFEAIKATAGVGIAADVAVQAADAVADAAAEKADEFKDGPIPDPTFGKEPKP